MYFLVWVFATESVLHLKHIISQKIGYLIKLQHLIFGGKALQDPRPLMYYNIISMSTITLNLRLRGGATASCKTKNIGGIRRSLTKNTETQNKHRNGGFSFKNILQGKITATAPSKQARTETIPYTVEKLNYTP